MNLMRQKHQVTFVELAVMRDRLRPGIEDGFRLKGELESLCSGVKLSINPIINHAPRFV